MEHPWESEAVWEPEEDADAWQFLGGLDDVPPPLPVEAVGWPWYLTGPEYRMAWECWMSPGRDFYTQPFAVAHRRRGRARWVSDR